MKPRAFVRTHINPSPWSFRIIRHIRWETRVSSCHPGPLKEAWPIMAIIAQMSPKVPLLSNILNIFTIPTAKRRMCQLCILFSNINIHASFRSALLIWITPSPYLYRVSRGSQVLRRVNSMTTLVLYSDMPIVIQMSINWDAYTKQLGSTGVSSPWSRFPHPSLWISAAQLQFPAATTDALKKDCLCKQWRKGTLESYTPFSSNQLHTRWHCPVYPLDPGVLKKIPCSSRSQI